MTTLKTIDALTASSVGVSRMQITFDEESGLITAIGDCTLPRDKVDFYYGDDCLLFAGMGDVHIHAREDISGKNNYKEDFTSVSAAALNGGVVHLGDMPNNPIPPIDDETYLKKVELSKKSEVPILMYAGIGPKTRPLSFPVPYKAYMGPSVGDLFFKNNEELDEVLRYYRNESVSFHCEDPEVLEESKLKADHFSRRPIKAELLATDYALFLIEKYNLQGKLCHYSAGDGLDSIKKAKANGLKVSCEVTPQHLYFSEESIRAMSESDQIQFQMNPPIRSISDSKKLLAALLNNEIDYLATDHAPHSPEEKCKGMSGLPGLDTYASFVTWLLIDQKIAPETIARVACENPGKFFNQFLPALNNKTDRYKKWGRGMGFLEVGFSASFTILNLKRPVTISRNHLKTKANWSPFLGITFPGSLEGVFLSGKRF